jgi:hypothetical protein
MKMELNLILNQSNSRFFGNFIKTKCFKNLKTNFKGSTKSSIGKKKLQLKPNVTFEINNHKYITMLVKQDFWSSLGLKTKRSESTWNKTQYKICFNLESFSKTQPWT